MIKIFTLLFLAFTSCIIRVPQTPPATPTPGPTQPHTPITPPPAWTPIPWPSQTPYPIQTAEADVPFTVVMPQSAKVDVPFTAKVTAKESTIVQIWVEKTWYMGEMRWDSDNKIKYLNFKLNTPGSPRMIDFKVDGVWLYSQQIEVSE